VDNAAIVHMSHTGRAAFTDEGVVSLSQRMCAFDFGKITDNRGHAAGADILRMAAVFAVGEIENIGNAQAAILTVIDMFNLGIAGGAWLGGHIVASLGLIHTAWIGSLVVLGALALTFWSGRLDRTDTSSEHHQNDTIQEPATAASY